MALWSLVLRAIEKIVSLIVPKSPTPAPVLVRERRSPYKRSR